MKWDIYTKLFKRAKINLFKVVKWTLRDKLSMNIKFENYFYNI